MSKKPKREEEPFERALSTYSERKIKWLWRYLIPENVVCILEGEGEVGKSRVARFIAARCSRGEPLPGETEGRAAMNVLICSFSEDPVEEITLPQIRRMGGDLNRVFVVEKPFTFDEEGLGELKDAIRRRRAKLVILDPLADYVPAHTDSYKDEQVRRFVMGPLSLLARGEKVTIIAIRHFKKGRGEDIKYRGLGSAAHSNVSRAALAFIRDPGVDLDAQRFVLGPNKGSWVAVKRRRYPRFEIRETKDEIGRLQWLPDSERSIAELDQEWHHKGASGEATEMAKEFLERELANGPVAMRALRERKPIEMSWKTVERARRALGVVTKGGHRGRPAQWLLRKDAVGIVLPSFHGVRVFKKNGGRAPERRRE
jgi:hypothetical protein